MSYPIRVECPQQILWLCRTGKEQVGKATGFKIAAHQTGKTIFPLSYSGDYNSWVDFQVAQVYPS